MRQLNDNKLGIRCEWMEKSRILVNPDGQVWPCCFLANKTYEGEKRFKTVEWNYIHHIQNREPTLKKYYDNKEYYNINNTPLEEIIHSDWFTKHLPESWDDEDTAPGVCKRFCRSCKS